MLDQSIPSDEFTLTQRPQALGHQELKLLLGKNADVLPDTPPVWIRQILFLRQHILLRPVVHSIYILLDIPIHVKESGQVIANDPLVIGVVCFLFGCVESTSWDTVNQRRVGPARLDVYNRKLAHEVGCLVIPKPAVETIPQTKD